MTNVDKIEQLIQRAKLAHMSNAKWRKLFKICGEYSQSIGGIMWKFVGCDTLINCTICVTDCLLDEERFADYFPNPYAKLNEIEWIFIPYKYSDPNSDPKRPLPLLENNLTALIEHLEKYCKFPITNTENGIKIIGYEW
ncbi:hypothetical protein ACJJIQ_02045 [Microbulbifer sp. ANSA003]|uniref:hypothetical protein n=1 Tax=Microbulbifer sp. ANSA003 TaxID=3243360 RepID=UPI0040435514